MLATGVFVACAITSLICAIALWRGYKQTKERLLFWATLCFVGLFINNLLLSIDFDRTSADIALLRLVPALVGVSLLIYGLVWEVDK